MKQWSNIHQSSCSAFTLERKNSGHLQENPHVPILVKTFPWREMRVQGASNIPKALKRSRPSASLTAYKRLTLDCVCVAANVSPRGTFQWHSFLRFFGARLVLLVGAACDLPAVSLAFESGTLLLVTTCSWCPRPNPWGKWMFIYIFTRKKSLTRCSWWEVGEETMRMSSVGNRESSIAFT